jgi:DNA-binding MarR family transcriptional regulator
MERKINPHDLLVALLRLQNTLERRSDAFFQPYGLTSAQFNILNLLGTSAGRMEQLALVELLLVGKSSISVVLNRMVRDDLVRREDHPQDRRQVILVLTPKGRALWRKIAKNYENGVKQIFGALPAKRRGSFVEDLSVIQEALNRSFPNPEKYE